MVAYYIYKIKNRIPSDAVFGKESDSKAIV